MSIRLMTQVWRMDLPPAEKLVLLALADNASDEGNCYPSISTLVKKSSLSEPTVHRCIKKLVTAGYVVCHFRQGRSTVYSILMRGSHDDTLPHSDTYPPSQRYPTSPHGDTPPPLTMTPTPPHGDTHNHQVTIIEPSEESSNNRKPRKQVAENKKNGLSVLKENRFDELKVVFPKRGGSHRWGDAERAYNQRIEEGHTHEEILAGIRRYANYVAVTCKEKTEHVQQAATFLGRNKGFTELWQPPAQVKDVRQMSAVERVQLATERLRSERNERVVSEQTGSSFESLEQLMRDVR